MGSVLSSEHQSNHPQTTPSTCSIRDLSKNDLALIFKYLPPFDRLRVSEVCKRWNAISAAPWHDIRRIDLTPIPRKNIRAILERCPNTEAVFAQSKHLESKEDLHILSRMASVSSVKLYKCRFYVLELALGRIDLFPALFSEGLTTSAAWTELVLCDAEVGMAVHSGSFAAGGLPVSLQRLQLCNIGVVRRLFWVVALGPLFGGPNFLGGLGCLQNLTCLILCSSDFETVMDVAFCQAEMRRELRMPTNLRELCVVRDILSGAPLRWDLAELPRTFPRLQVLFLHNIRVYSDDSWASLALNHPTLRILVITGPVCNERTIPERRVYPNGFGSDPLPLLRVFLGKQNSERMRFTKSSSAALRVYPITRPLPEFLDSEEIAPIFDGVWIAAQIKESAKWNFGRDVASPVRLPDVE